MRRQWSFAILICAIGLGLGSCTDPVTQSSARSWSTADREVLTNGLSNVGDLLFEETKDLTEDQWNFRSTQDAWCIGEVVEHLAIHDALFFREVKSTSSLPEHAMLADSLVDQDQYLMDYAEVTTANSGEAPWYLDPQLHWCSSRQTWPKFQRSHDQYIDFISDTKHNLRAFYTSNGRGQNPYRDLHQLVLISIVHAERHISQIQSIKSHPEFPHHDP